MKSSTTLACLILLCFCGHAVAQVDQIFPTKGAPLSGSIKETSPVQITINSGGADRKVAVNELRRVTFKEDPPELKSGRAKIAAGRIQSGYDEIKRVDPAGIARPIVRQDLQFYLAYCDGKLSLTIGGDKPKAERKLMAFVRAAPTSHHFFAAAELLGDLAASQGKYADAVKFYGAIASKAPWIDYKMQASLNEARALVAQGNFAGAEAKYKAVAGAGTDTAEAKRQKLIAQIGIARCMAETSSPDAGIDIIEKVIDENDPSDNELFGRAYNAHGDCLQKAGKTKEALRAYLHVDLLFYANPEIHAEALYHLSKLWDQTKNPDRAVAARNMLSQRYAGSVWSSKQ